MFKSTESENKFQDLIFDFCKRTVNAKTKDKSAYMGNKQQQNPFEFNHKTILELLSWINIDGVCALLNIRDLRDKFQTKWKRLSHQILEDLRSKANPSTYPVPGPNGIALSVKPTSSAKDVRMRTSSK